MIEKDFSFSTIYTFEDGGGNEITDPTIYHAYRRIDGGYSVVVDRLLVHSIVTATVDFTLDEVEQKLRDGEWIFVEEIM